MVGSSKKSSKVWAVTRNGANPNGFDACKSVSNLSSTTPSPARYTAPFKSFSIILLFRHRNERLAGPHDNRLQEVYPAALAHGDGRQQAQPLVAAGVDLEDRDTPPGLDNFQAVAGDDPVASESERATGPDGRQTSEVYQ